MSKRKIAFIINLIIIVLELIAFGYTICNEHKMQIEYYTIESNLITLVSSLLFVILIRKKKEFVKDLRFLSTILLTVTFLVVIFVLCPMYNFNYKLLMFTDTFLVFHTICPILTIISYIFFEEGSKKKYLGLVYTALYAVVLITLNILDVVVGPYPFLEVKKQSLLMVSGWGIAILSGSYLIGLLIYKLNKRKGAK